MTIYEAPNLAYHRTLGKLVVSILWGILVRPMYIMHANPIFFTKAQPPVPPNEIDATTFLPA